MAGIMGALAARGGRVGAAINFLASRPDASSALLGAGIGLVTTGSISGGLIGGVAGVVGGGRFIKGQVKNERGRIDRRIAGLTTSRRELLQRAEYLSFGTEQATVRDLRVAGDVLGDRIRGIQRGRNDALRAVNRTTGGSLKRSALYAGGAGLGLFAVRSVGNSFGSGSKAPNGTTFSGMHYA